VYDNGVRIYRTENSGHDGNGICAAMAMAYCADFLRGKRDAATERTGKNLELVKSYHQESIAVQRATHEMDQRNRAKGVAVPAESNAFSYQDEHLAKIYRIRATAAATFKASVLFLYTPGLNATWFVGHDEKIDGGGHAIAISTGGAANEICVLDPNYGLFKYNDKEKYTLDLKIAFALYMNQTWGRATMALA
jgi:hypothetical protein